MPEEPATGGITSGELFQWVAGARGLTFTRQLCLILRHSEGFAYILARRSTALTIARDSARGPTHLPGSYVSLDPGFQKKTVPFPSLGKAPSPLF